MEKKAFLSNISRGSVQRPDADSFGLFLAYPLFLKPVAEIKKISWCQEKWRRSANKMVYAKGTFLLWGFCIPSFRAIAYAIDKQRVACRRYLLLQGLCQVSKLQHLYVIGLILSSVLKTTKHTRLYLVSHYLHQAARGEGKNSLRKHRDILFSYRDQQRFFIIIIT